MKRPSYTKGLSLILTSLLFIAFITVNGPVGYTLILILLGLVGATLLYSLTKQYASARVSPATRLYTNDFTIKFLGTLMGLFLVVGTATYLYVFHTIARNEDVEFNNAEYFIRSLMCSFQLFVFNIDSNILDRLDHEPLIKAWLSIQAVLSSACTVTVLVGLVYSRLRAYYRLTYATRIDDEHNHLYLFFGVNEPSEKLAADIKLHDPKAVVILIDEVNVNDEYTSEMDGILKLVTHRPKTIDTADRNDIRIAVANKRLSEIDDEIVRQPDFDAFGCLGLPRIAKLIEKLKKTDDAQLHILFLDDNEERNIRDIIALAKDRTITSVALQSNVLQILYCHARYNGPNRVIEDVAVKKNLNIKIIDSSHLAVERLKLMPEYHPYHVVDMDKHNPATVSGSFDALIVGFGEVGRDAFRFLYEFAAFADNDASATNARRSRFNCTIVDKDIDRIKGVFKASMPGIFSNDTCHNIDFRAIDHNEEAFYTEVLSPDRIARLNYIVISIGDSDEAIALATRIFNRYRQYGGNLDKLIILVRCTDDSKVEALQKIADHYNYGYSIGVEKDQAPTTTVIRIFGQPEETYTYELVISNQIIRLGKRFHEQYRVIKGENETWDERHYNFTHTGRPLIDKLRKLRRQESQDIANALHVPTKIAFLRAAMPADTDWENFFVRYFWSDGTPDRTGSGAGITYPLLTARENLTILHLAMLEHLRWNAAHELLGYVRRDDGKASCDETTMRHNCLKSWGELDHESQLTQNDWPMDYKEFDFAVVDTSVSLWKAEKKNHSPMKPNYNYTPQPVDTSDVKLPDDLLALAEEMAKNVHEVWAQARISDGWTYGPQRNDAAKTHPCLVAYDDLPESEKEYDRATSQETLKLILKSGFVISKK